MLEFFIIKKIHIATNDFDHDNDGGNDKDNDGNDYNYLSHLSRLFS